MKLLFIILLSICVSHAQMPTVSLISAGSNCKTPTLMYVSYDIDIAPGGGVWVEWLHLGSWSLVQNSQHFTVVPGIDSYEFTITPTLDSLLTQYPQDSTYRFRFVDIITEVYQTIDTFYTYCPHTFSLEELKENEEIAKTEYFNLHGGLVNDKKAGFYLILYTFIDGRQRAVKRFIQ